MPALPVLSGQQMVSILERLGWTVARRRGSHIVMTKEGHIATLSIPNHREVAKGTLRSIVRSAGLPLDEFLAAIDRY